MSLVVNRISWTDPEKPGRKFALVYRHILINQKQCSKQKNKIKNIYKKKG